MSRSHWSRIPARATALASLSALLFVPALHGSLGHQDASCDPVRVSGCHLAAGDTFVGAVSGARVCPLCLASSQARTLLPTGAAHAIRADAIARAAALPAPWLAPTPLARCVCGPRAPPIPA